MAIRIAGLVDWDDYKNKSKSKQDELKRGRGFSKSGLDWDQPEEPGVPKTKEEMAEHEDQGGQVIQEWGLEEDDPAGEEEQRSLKAMIKSIHKHAAELYNLVDEMDDPEDWVLEKAKECAAKVAEIHSHIDYNKEKAEELNTTPGADAMERGW